MTYLQLEEPLYWIIGLQGKKYQSEEDQAEISETAPALPSQDSKQRKIASWESRGIAEIHATIKDLKDAGVIVTTHYHIFI